MTRSLRIVSAAAGLLLLTPAVPAAAGSVAQREQNQSAAAVDRANLRLAALAVESQALRATALTSTLGSSAPAVVLFKSVNALLVKARADDPTLRPRSTGSIMGPTPYNLSHETARPTHRGITITHTLQHFTHRVTIPESAGWGMKAFHGHSHPATFQRPDGVYVDPKLPSVAHPLIASVAIRVAMQRLGQPYVWAAAGPTTFDCSGLTMWAYAHAGIRLRHYTGWQWNEGRLIKPADVLPGDLLLIGSPIHHVGMYLGAGWMINSPFTGHYVDVVPVPTKVAGIIRP